MSHIIFFWTGSFGNEEVHKIGENVVQDKVEDNAQLTLFVLYKRDKKIGVLGVE